MVINLGKGVAKDQVAHMVAVKEAVGEALFEIGNPAKAAICSLLRRKSRQPRLFVPYLHLCHGHRFQKLLIHNGAIARRSGDS